jgi:hypothetical protein
MDGASAEPRRKGTGEAEFALRARAVCLDFVPHLLEAGVWAAPPAPLLTCGGPVRHEGLLMTSPHQDGRVVLPAVVRSGQRAEDLQRFDALFAEAPAIEHGRRSRE